MSIANVGAALLATARSGQFAQEKLQRTESLLASQANPNMANIFKDLQNEVELKKTQILEKSNDQIKKEAEQRIAQSNPFADGTAKT